MDDPRTYNEMKSRLEEAIASLKSEFQAAQDGIREQVAATNDRLGNLIWILTDRESSKDGAENGEGRTGELAIQLAERERTIQASSQHITDLERTILELKSELAQLRSQESWIVATNQDLSERLVAAHAQEKAQVKVLSDAENEIARLNRTIAEYEDKDKSRVKQNETLRRERNEARQAVKHLSDEVTMLRRANSYLQSTLEATRKRDEVRERRQRIVLEALASNGHARKLGEILSAASVISDQQLADALEEQEIASNRMLGEILIDKGLVAEEEVAQTVACQLNLPFIHLCNSAINNETARMVEEKECEEHHCIPLRTAGDRVFVAMANPTNTSAIDRMAQRTNRKVVPLVATSSDITSAVRRVFGAAIAS